MTTTAERAAPGPDGPTTDGPTTDGRTPDGPTTDGPATDGPTTNGAPTPTFEQLAGAVDDAMRAAAQLDGPARKVADALRESIEAAHRAALVTIVRRLRSDEAGRAALYELVDDPLIHLLFSVHGIIRPDPLTQARAALDTIRPGLQSHGGDVELVRIEDGTAFVRLTGACNGCSMSAVTMRNTVQDALIETVASISAVEVLPSEPSPTLIPLSAIGRRPSAPEHPAELGWVKTATTGDIADGQVTELQLTSSAGLSVDAIIVRIGASLTAYRNECAHQGLPLGDAMLDAAAGTLTCPWHGFCYDALSGDCMSAPGAALEQLPLRVDEGYVWVRVQ